MILKNIQINQVFIALLLGAVIGAAGIQLRLHFDPTEVRLEVSDDGNGFNPACQGTR